ncbi:MAG: HAD family phosphatase [Streptococcaceae bacterium]|jgi:putative hydrolase of the HAD superfamily|nr:HAD family phosphatase [Streptococcaceae bacterium]
MKTEAIIFDLGGVILDLGFEAMLARFLELGVTQQQLAGSRFFDEGFETGLVSADDCFSSLRALSGHDLSAREMTDAWNLMITDFVPERMAVLETLAKKVPIYLFSNTNAIHATYFKPLCEQQMGKPFENYFTKAFYSHELGLRKPYPEAFKKVLALSELTAKNTLFIDDNANNIKGAARTGLQTLHLSAPTTLLDLEFNL